MSTTQLSIVAPMHNEAEGMGGFFSRLLPVLEATTLPYEIICVNDGSTDATLAQLLLYRDANPRIKIVDLSRNFGKDVALTAGMDHATGSAVIPIDADLQDPPELIHELIAKWREGYEVVYATRRTREGDSPLKRFTARLFYRILDRLSDVHVPHDTGDFRLLDRRAADAIKRLPERARFMKGLFSWVGFKQTAVYYDRSRREAGDSKWHYLALFRFAIDGITSLSSVPLRMWTYLGLLVSLPAFLYAAFLIVRTLIYGIDVPGYASLIVVVLFFGGVQLIGLGVLGEYVGRIYNEVKQRPLYLVSDLYGFDSERKTGEPAK